MKNFPIVNILLPVLLLIIYPLCCHNEQYLQGSTANGILLLGFVVSFMFDFFHGKTFHVTILDILFYSCIIWNLCMLWYHGTFYEGILIRYINYIFCYLCFRNVSSSKGLLFSLFIGGGVQMIFVLLQQAGMMYSFHYAFPITGTFSNPAILSIFLSISLLAGVGLYPYIQQKKMKLFWWISVIVIFWGIVTTHSRASWLALILELSLLFIEKYNSLLKHYKIKAIYGWCMIGTLSVLVLITLYFIHPESIHGRFLIWQIIGNAIIENPSGHGLLQSHYMTMQADWLKNHTDSVYSLYAGNNIHAFNEILHITFEMGVIGLLLFGLLLFTTIKHAVRNRESSNPNLILKYLEALNNQNYSEITKHKPLIINTF